MPAPAMIRMEVVQPLSSLANRCGFFDCGVQPEAYESALKRDGCPPSATTRVKRHAHDSRLVVGAYPGVAAIFEMRDLAKVVQAVIGRIAVDVIDHFRLLAVNHRPNSAMCLPIFAADPTHPVPATVDRRHGFLARPALVPRPAHALGREHIERTWKPIKRPSLALISKESS